MADPDFARVLSDHAGAVEAMIPSLLRRRSCGVLLTRNGPRLVPLEQLVKVAAAHGRRLVKDRGAIIVLVELAGQTAVRKLRVDDPAPVRRIEATAKPVDVQIPRDLDVVTRRWIEDLPVKHRAEAIRLVRGNAQA